MSEQPFPSPPERPVTERSSRVPDLPFWQRMHPVAFATVALVLIFILYQVVGGGAAYVLSGGKVTADNASFIRWATVISQILLILVPALVLARLRYRRLSIPFPLKVLGVFSLQQLLQAYMTIQDAMPLPPKVREIVDLVKGMYEETYRVLVSAHTPGEFLVVVFTVALIPAVAEEFLFRGLVQRTLSEHTNGMRAAIATGIIFGAYHMNPISVIPLVLLGTYFGYLVYRSGNLAISISVHFFNNFLACAAAYMTVPDDFLALSPGARVNGPLLIANTVVFFVVFVASTYYFAKVTDDQA
jgi:membrane protease YdiL (CAAX protease family)